MDMSKADYEDAIVGCYKIAMALGKNGAEQNRIITLIKEIDSNSSSYNEAIKTMLATLYAEAYLNAR